MKYSTPSHLATPEGCEEPKLSSASATLPQSCAARSLSLDTGPKCGFTNHDSIPTDWALLVVVFPLLRYGWQRPLCRVRAVARPAISCDHCGQVSQPGPLVGWRLRLVEPVSTCRRGADFHTSEGRPRACQAKPVSWCLPSAAGIISIRLPGSPRTSRLLPLRHLSGSPGSGANLPRTSADPCLGDPFPLSFRLSTSLVT